MVELLNILYLRQKIFKISFSQILKNNVLIIFIVHFISEYQISRKVLIISSPQISVEIWDNIVSPYHDNNGKKKYFNLTINLGALGPCVKRLWKKIQNSAEFVWNGKIEGAKILKETKSTQVC